MMARETANERLVKNHHAFFGDCPVRRPEP
jgi:hypothetical protein